MTSYTGQKEMTNTLLFEVIVMLSPLALTTLIVNVAYDSLGVDGTVTVASYTASFTVAFAFNPSI